jgi:hypothetical protein
LRDELPELITNTDFDVAIAYALKLSGVRSVLFRPTSSSHSRQASPHSIRSKRVWMDGWMKNQPDHSNKPTGGSIDQVVERELGWMDENINRITATSPLGDRSIRS